MPFQPPIRDLLFCLTEIVGIERLGALGAFSGLDRATLVAVLEAAGQVTGEVLAPLNASGDKAGATCRDGDVTAPPGFAEAYRTFAAGGWTGLSADPAFGGQGLPKTLAVAVWEMVQAADMAFGLCPILTQGASEAIDAHGSDRLKALYLPRLASGEWTGVMALTEPQSGSDLSTLRTRAEPDGKGGYRLHGQKIFITWGDHDLADNIVHLVLARLPDAPDGSRGISLFLAPKRLVGEDGALGERNAFRPARIEHKMGLHASPTCEMLYEGAQAELIGEPHKGLANMFTMMNSARLNVGVQGVGVAERAYQQALAYALERRQGRSIWSGEASAPIFDHPDVRRMLAGMKAKIEAARAICLLTAVNADLATHASGDEARRAAKLREELLTPVAKAWSTDVGVEVARLGMQIHGGAGFIEETGAAQHYRDGCVTPIYEGTNGIQAIDLVGRKLSMESGRAMTELLAEMGETCETLREDQRAIGLDLLAGRLENAVQALESAGAWLLERRSDADGLAGATPFQTLMGDVVGGWLLAKGALAAASDEHDQAYVMARVRLASHYAETVLAQAPGRIAGVIAGAESLRALDAAALGG